MAKKHARNAGFLIYDVVSLAPPPPPRDLPFNIGTLLLPRLIQSIATGRHIDEAKLAAAYLVFKSWIDNLNAGKLNEFSETQVEGDFTGHLLTALGYKTQGNSPNEATFTMLPKWTVEGAGIADVALGVFHFDESNKLVGSARVVIELKGAKADLDKRMGGRSPVEQAWVYLNRSEGADWAIVSNFVEIRLYHRKGSNYVHRIRLIDLIDEGRFAEFYAVFHAESLLGTGNFPHNTAWLLQQTEEKQETVGDELYREYKVRRKELIRELTVKGYPFDKSVTAAQKLLDRILFVAFAEDRGLLDSSGKILENIATQVVFRRTKWNNFQALFEAIDLGDPPSQIPQYNGELFKPDDILDDRRLQLDDKWATVFKEIGKYDFKDEVTEAVLGRIFELSIDDIEQLKQEGQNGVEAHQPTQKVPGRRDLQGVFYTNSSIVDYLVNAALQPAYEAEKARLAIAHSTDPEEPSAAFARAMIDWLDHRTVCDPSCGSGAFLSRAYNWFEDRRILLLNQLHDAEPADPICQGHPEDWRARSAQSILRNNLYGVDLSEESVEIARLALWVRTARRDQKLTNLAENVMRGNSVVSDENVDQYFFDWQARFPRVFASGGFDAIIGNPPYVRQEHLGPIKEHLQANFQAYHGMADLYVYFYERGLSLLRPGGRLAYVVTNKWMKAGYGEPLRKLFSDHSWVESVVDFGHAKQFFKDVEVFPCFLVVRKPNEEKLPETTKACIVTGKDLDLKAVLDQVTIQEITIDRTRFGSMSWQLEPTSTINLFEKIGQGRTPLTEFVGSKPSYGIKTGLNEAFVIDRLTKEKLIRDDPKSAEVIKPFLRGRDITRWSSTWGGLYLIFTRRGIQIDQFPAIKKHLSLFRACLEPKPPDWQGDAWAGRKLGSYAWYEIQDSIDYWEEFESAKIFYQVIQTHPSYSLDLSGCLGNDKTFFILSQDLYLLSVLNSPLMWWHNFRFLPHMINDALTPQGFKMESLPIAIPTKKIRGATEKVARRLIQITKSQHTTCADLLDWLKVEFEIAEPNTKLQNPIGLDSDALIREVKKMRGKLKGLTNPQLKALRDEYARSIDPARLLADEARGLELQIHDLVNEAYGLSPDEVRLMWDTAPPRMPIARPPGV